MIFIKNKKKYKMKKLKLLKKKFKGFSYDFDPIELVNTTSMDKIKIYDCDNNCISKDSDSFFSEEMCKKNKEMDDIFLEMSKEYNSKKNKIKRLNKIYRKGKK